MSIHSDVISQVPTGVLIVFNGGKPPPGDYLAKRTLVDGPKPAKGINFHYDSISYFEDEHDEFEAYCG